MDELQGEYTMTKSKKSSRLGLFFVLFGVICMMLAGFLMWQKNNQPKIEVLTTDGVISKIQSLNRLQTVVYNVDTVITAQKAGNWYTLWQDKQKALFVAHGRVQAGIDLSELKPEHVSVSHETQNGKDGNSTQSVHITLPAAQVFETYLDNIEVYDIQTGVFGMVDVDPKIFSDAQVSGKQQVLKTACQSGILTLASDNAQKQIHSLFALANVNVVVNVVEPKACGT